MATAAQNKFTKNLSQSRKDVRGQRAKFIADDAKDAQENLVRNLKQEMRELERKQVNLEDIWPDDTTSMNAVKRDFDAAKWVQELQDNKLAIALKKVELDTAEATYKEYFE